MNSLWLIVIGLIAFIIAYVSYGAWLAKKWGIDDTIAAPSHVKYDGVDYVPAKPQILLGHHFASIAGAGPILGPVQAAVFGWVPVFLWIVIGSIFVGGVQDFGSLFASMRHEGKSIGQVIEVNIGKTGKKLFNIFAWLTLILVIAAFTDICANTFTSVPEAGTASLLFIVLAVLFGYFVYRKGAPLLISTIIGVILLFICIWIGYIFPIKFSSNAATNKIIWDIILLIYIAAASIVPVWILLQPRDYLNSFLLYGMLAGAVVGLFIARPALQLAPITGFVADAKTNNYLFPMLFVTVACGAVSGFHSLVGSGTSSKQIDKESDAKFVGYGAMLIEGLLAIVALITAGYLAGPKLTELLKNGGPANVFASGAAEFMNKFGLPVNVGKTFISLAVSAFALTSLDTATRIGRYIFQEFFEENSSEGKKNILTDKYVATVITVIFGGILTFMGYTKVWPIFGSANQLLAALALLAIAAYIIRQGRSAKMILAPMVFMFAVTLTALVLVMKTNLAAKNFLLLTIAVILFVLAVILIIEAWKVFFVKKDSSQNIKA